MGLDVKKSLLKVIDEDGLVSFIGDDILAGVIKAKLQQIVSDTSNPFDDMLLSVVYPKLEEAVMAYLIKEINEFKASA